MIDEAGTDIDQARKNIEEWYNDAMDRVSGWYKRRTQWILIGLGFVVAGLCNADTLTIANALARDKALRNSVVAIAEESAKNPPPTTVNRTPEEKIEEVRGQLNQLGLPIGWVNKSIKEDPRGLPEGGGWLIKLLGWLLTALAISQGAPFWFDVLNKFIVIRSTVKPREKSPVRPSKDTPAPETEEGKTDGPKKS